MPYAGKYLSNHGSSVAAPGVSPQLRMRSQTMENIETTFTPAFIMRLLEMSLMSAVVVPEASMLAQTE